MSQEDEVIIMDKLQTELGKERQLKWVLELRGTFVDWSTV